MPNDINNVYIEPLAKSHLRGDFCCKNQTIENFCRNDIRKQNDLNMIRAFVAVANDSSEVIGYYYLCLTLYAVGKIDEAADKKFGRMDAVPAVYLGMTGVHSQHDNVGVGKLLMRYALERTLVIAENAGTYALNLDAVDESVAGYYEDKFGFQRFTDGELKMFLPLGTIRAALAN